MAYLVNRIAASHIECLHTLCKFIFDKYSTNNFTMRDIKYNPDEKNIFSFCKLLNDNSLGIRYCPYKQNPLDEAGCYLTNGVDNDTTKSKEVSNTVNALQALGFVDRKNRSICLTANGIKFASAKYGTEEMQKIIETAVINYGPSIGILKQIDNEIDLDNREFDITKITVGYPVTEEKIKYNNTSIVISSGSKKDSNTRTRSCLISWLTTAGFIRPKSLPKITSGKYSHFEYREYLRNPTRNEHYYILEKYPPFCYDDKKISIVSRPLNYSNLTKDTAALRENGMKDTREATLKYEQRIQNRRFAIIYLLNNAYETKKKLSISEIYSFITKYPDFFVVTDKNLMHVIETELSIADMAGIPFQIEMTNDDYFFIPLTGIELQELCCDAPEELINLCKDFCK